MADGVAATISQAREALWQAWIELCEEQKGKSKRLFGAGYRFCDVILVAVLLGIAYLLYHVSTKPWIPFGSLHIGAAGVALLSLLGLCRVGMAFLLMAIPIFLFGCYKFALGAWPVEGWTMLYAMGRAIEAAICFVVAAYFFSKCAGDRVVNWLACIVLNARRGLRQS